MAGSEVANNIAQWNGATWQPLSSGTNGPVFSLAVFEEKLIVGGSFSSAGGNATNNIAQWDGTRWQPLGSGIEVVRPGTGNSPQVAALSTYQNKLVAGGVFDTAGGVSSPGIAEWNGTSWQSIGDGVGGRWPFVFALTPYRGSLIAAGSFATAGGIDANMIAQWNGRKWQVVGRGLDRSVTALSVYDGNLIAAGLFISGRGAVGNRIARWNGTDWQPLGNGLGDAVYPYYSYVGALTVYGSNLVAGGTCVMAGDVVSAHTARWHDCNLCEADVFPSDGGDRIVNIDDLLAVITNWNTLGPNPGDANHNGITDIDDLLTVITAWGPCL
jgi:hypothetical protein